MDTGPPAAAEERGAARPPPGMRSSQRAGRPSSGAWGRHLPHRTHATREGRRVLRAVRAEGRPGSAAEPVSNSCLRGLVGLSPAQEEHLGRLGWQWPSADGPEDRNFSAVAPARAVPRTWRASRCGPSATLYGTRRPRTSSYRRFDDAGRGLARSARPSGIPAEARAPAHPRDRGAGAKPRAAAEFDALVDRGSAHSSAWTIFVRDEDGDIPIRTEMRSSS